MFLGEARTPDDMRLYAIGDVHGCDDLLGRAHAAIADDLAANPAPDHRLIHVGDYVDRGPDSAGVIERLVALDATDDKVVSLIGNHDILMRDFLDDPFDAGDIWLVNGGDRTLESYGIDASGWRQSARMLQDLSARLSESLPARHRDFLAARPVSAQFGDFFFCHAGIRPGVPLGDQVVDDLTWIRGEFLDDPRDNGVVVVHGHTPAPKPEVRRNRINIDTGAVFGGALTVLCLEGTDHRFLSL